MDGQTLQLSASDGLAFVVVAITINVAMQLLKTAVRRGDLTFTHTTWFKAYVLPGVTMLLGLLAALPPTLLPGGDLGARLIAGLAVGWAATWNYNVFKSRDQ